MERVNSRKRKEVTDPSLSPNKVQCAFSQKLNASRTSGVRENNQAMTTPLSRRLVMEENMEGSITVSVNDLCNPLLSIPKNKLISLKIENFEDLEQCQSFFSTRFNSEITSKIQELILWIDINDEAVEFINSLFITITKNINSFPNLKSLLISPIFHVYHDVTLTLPSLLTSLEISWIRKNITLNLFGSLPNLAILQIGDIDENATINLPNSLNSLTTIKIGNFDSYAVIKLPNSLPKLINMTISNFWNPCLTLPNSRINLASNLVTYAVDIFSHLNRDYFKYNSVLQLLHLSPELTNLVIENIYCADVKLPDTLDNLKTLIIGTMGFDVILALPSCLNNNLKSLSIGHIKKGAVLKFPIALNNLENLSIGRIDKEESSS